TKPCKDVLRRALAVAATVAVLLLVPVANVRVAAGQDRSNSGVEAPPLRLDEVAERFLDAPLARRRVPARQLLRQRPRLRRDRRTHSRQQLRRRGWIQNRGIVPHRPISSGASVRAATHLSCSLECNKSPSPLEPREIAPCRRLDAWKCENICAILM